MMERHFDDTREHLLATGEGIMLGKGFAAVGLAEILGSAGVPKGSFYHYFESKEGYGVALLERFFANYLGTLDGIVANTALNGRSKLETFFSNWDALPGETNCESRCLVVKLTGEVSDLSAAMRKELERGIAGIVERLAACIVIGRADRSIPPGTAADTLAASLYQLWLGAALVAKVQHNQTAFTAARHATDLLLA
ncbi:TetR/AcrR family transcriptional regulator [Chitinimonas sp. BJB300]|uniref:TetR/AcrR family transcriptional regulator n=1 Tax=Chitinimonas sp. BJB300 TaxID=1559339 RepID=UPI000C10CD3C|nr:TetR/AcrR family transcriptional regulator [Chitinimonas sp. BJB300]PHV10398.1 TetR family transcriptional regulator [Chitinimonas sp. BJB300]TSJ83835.1 TetR/AcrR family transcriptional regulator [Chitinimonas sp. BJB300]